MEQEKMRREKELESLEEQLRQCTAKSQITDSELQYPFFIGVFVMKKNGYKTSPFYPEPSSRFLQKELESLRNAENELEILQSEVEEDTTEVIPSAV